MTTNINTEARISNGFGSNAGSLKWRDDAPGHEFLSLQLNRSDTRRQHVRHLLQTTIRTSFLRSFAR